MRTLRLVVSCATLCGCLSTIALAQAAPPSAEIQRLSFYVGGWSETGQMRDDPAKPFKPIAGGETCTWAAGGSAVLCQENTSGEGGGWNGVYILSYDAATKQYHVHGTELPGGNMHAVGHVEGARWIWLTDAAPDGSRARYTFTPSANGSRALTVEAGSGTNWAAIANITYSVKK